MAQVMWIEILARHGQVAARFRCNGPVLHVGRGYRNDVVLDDPAVAPEHLRISQGEDGAIVAEAVDPAFGFSISGKPRDRSLIDGDTVLRIGHTWLRIRDANYAVPAVAAAAPQSRAWLAPGLLVAVTLALTGFLMWLDETTEPRLTRYGGAMLAIGLVLLLWSAAWALVSRVFSTTAHFRTHLTIAFSGFLAYTLYYVLGGVLGFSLSSPLVATNLALMVWPVLAAVCFFHLQTIAPPRPAIKAGLLVVLAAIGIGVQVSNQLELRKAGAQPPIARTDFPPAFRLARPASEDQFFAGVAALKPKLDADRSTAP